MTTFTDARAIRPAPRARAALRIVRPLMVAALLALGAGSVTAERAGAQGGAADGDSATVQIGGQARDRGQLERAARTRIAALIRQQVGLTDAQMAKLQPVNGRFEQRRLALVRRERLTRFELRDVLVGAEGEGSSDDARIAELLQASIDIQRDRLDLIDAEQKELAAFMTPRQRARYLDLQLKMRARLDEVQRRRGAGAGVRRPGRPMRPPQ